MNPTNVRPKPFVPGVRTYQGSCHCKAVRYEVDLDLSQRTTRCNCTVCTKAASWGTIVKPSAFRLLTSPEKLGDYSLSEAGHARFCTRCGIRTHGHGNIPELGGAFVSVNLNTLDDAQLGGVKVDYLDGRANTWATLNASPHLDPFGLSGVTEGRSQTGA